MERRELLVGLTTLLFTPATVLAATTAPSSRRFRWTANGRVFQREGDGWVESISLGEEVRILHIDDFGQQATLTAIYAGRRFRLQTRDGRHWRAA